MAVTQPAAMNLRPSDTGFGIRVVAIGGGTGLSTLLKGLKRYVLPAGEAPAELGDGRIKDLCAVVTVSDDGGSSGRLRKELNMLPPGDIRNCIVALSEDEAMLSRLFQHRFMKGSGLEGHSSATYFLPRSPPSPPTSPKLCACLLRSFDTGDTSPFHYLQHRTGSYDGGRLAGKGETNITASKGRIRELFLVPPDVGRCPKPWKPSPAPT